MSTPHQTAPVCEKSQPAPVTKDFGFLPIRRGLQHDPKKPQRFGLVLNLLFGFTATFIAANLYYSQPLLMQLAQSFDVLPAQISNLTMLAPGGYACGLILLAPLGDIVRRRPLLLLLIFFATAITAGISCTPNLTGFQVLSFFVGVCSVVPQVLIPLTADLAPPHKRAFSISIVVSGVLLGVMTARVLSGIIANFTSWRVVYYAAAGVQLSAFTAIWALLPDYPANNASLSYFGALKSMAEFAVTEPLLIQCCLINLAGSVCFSNSWVTLTFLLSDVPYHYSTLVIGLFGVIGMAGVATSPLLGKIVDKIMPWFASLFAISLLICFQAVQTAAGGIEIAAVILAIFGSESVRQMNQVALTTNVATIDPSARARLNSVLVLFFFTGQLMGGAVGSKVFLQYGWRASSLLNMTFMGFMLFMLMIRGPHVSRHTWFGWEGGWEVRRQVPGQSAVDEESAKDFDSETHRDTATPGSETTTLAGLTPAASMTDIAKAMQKKIGESVIEEAPRM